MMKMMMMMMMMMQEEVCSDVVTGYSSATRCSSFPRESCAVEKRRVAKVTPETGCDKRPVELCAPRGCGLVNVSLTQDVNISSQDL